MLSAGMLTQVLSIPITILWPKSIADSTNYCFWKVLPIPMPVLLWQYFLLFTAFINVHFSTVLC